MGVTSLDRAIHEYIGNSLAPSTRSTYRSATNRYLTFCDQLGAIAFPLQIDTVLRFVVYLAEGGTSITSLRVYLSGIRFAQIAADLPDPGLSTSPSLHYVLRGVCWSQGPQATNCRLPITSEILQRLHTLSSEEVYQPSQLHRYTPSSNSAIDRAIMYKTFPYTIDFRIIFIPYS